MKFTKKELMFLITISLALGIRQMAMTMVMPFISIYSKTLSSSTPLLAGLALGIFGLAQAIFQIPFGIWSDKLGNKRVMLFGLMQVIIGLCLASLASSIYVLILARALQGSGAVIAVGYSWVTGSVSESKRPRSLGIIGTIVGFAAASSFALGSIVNNFLSVKNMFLVSAVLILAVWLAILIFLQDGGKETGNPESRVDAKQSMRILGSNRTFVRLNILGFINNFIMAGVFFTVPQYISKILGPDGMWKIFMPAVIAAILCMRSVIRFVEKGYSSLIITLFFAVTAAGLGFFFQKNSIYFLLIGCILFMTGYIVISTVIPSMANDIAENSYRGTANGVINSFQYIGSFAGPVAAGALWNNNQQLVIIILIIMALLGLYIMAADRKGKTR